MFALSVAAVQVLLPLVIQTLISLYVGEIGLALIVTWRFNDSHRS